MSTVIKKTPNNHGQYRVIYEIELPNYPVDDWLHDPDFSTVTDVPQRYWKVDVSSVVEMDQAEKDAVDSSLHNKANLVGTGLFTFEKDNICRNAWLGLGPSKSSDTTPYIVPVPLKVTAVTFVNNVDGADTDVEIYKNGSLIHTWEIRDKRYAWKTVGLHVLEFLPGDYVGIYLKDRGTDPRNVIITLHYSSWTHEVGEGGAISI